MNDQQPAKSGVSTTGVLWVFIIGLVLGLFIGIVGGPLIERYFGSDASRNPANAKVVPNPNPPPREGQEAPPTKPADGASKPAPAPTSH